MLILIKKLNSFFKYKRKCLKFMQCPSQFNKSSLCRSDGNHSTKLKVLFFGTDNFSLPSLKALHENFKIHDPVDGLATVTSFKSPANCVRQYAEKNNLKLFKWPIQPQECKDFDLGVVVSFGHLIPEPIINSFPLGMINVHASLLPRWRGAAPIIYAIMHGDKTTGVSIMKIEPKRFDIGDILAQREIEIKENILMPELHEELSLQGAHLLLDVIKSYPESFQKSLKQQSHLVTYAPKITTAITHINWSEISASDVYKRYRALYGYKHLTTYLNGRSILLIEIGLPTESLNNLLKDGLPGSFVFHRERKSLLIKCADGFLIEIFKIRVEGKKIMSSVDFNNGFVKHKKKFELIFENR